LDLAAAPGSKATQIAAMMENSGFLILNDISKKRLRSLNSNVQKAGLINQVILHLPGEQFGNLFPNYFDKVLLDAPCTALGTLADRSEVSRWWSYAKLKKLSDLQKRLFISAFKALKTGGEIVYSTCSIAPEENELLVQSMIDTYPLKILEIKQFESASFSKGLTSYEGKVFHPDMTRAIRVMPHIHNIEGFFIIKLLKTADHKIHNMRKQMVFNSTLQFNDQMIVEDLENISEQWGIPQTIWKNYRYVQKKGRILLLHSDIENLPADGFVHAGIPLAEKRISGWKLTNQSVQFLGNLITKNRIELDALQMKALFSGAGVKLNGVSDGYHALEWEGSPIASLYAEKGNIKLRLPHLFRLEL
jgi:16S rRNA (cytosine1407-C5)-methyltransferase